MQCLPSMCRVHAHIAELWNLTNQLPLAPWAPYHHDWNQEATLAAQKAANKREVSVEVPRLAERSAKDTDHLQVHRM